MEDKKKRFAPRNEGTHKESGQRISVRPGNFTPPAASAEQAARKQNERGGKEGQKPEVKQANQNSENRRDSQKGGDRSSNRRGRHNRHRGGRGNHDKRQQHDAEKQASPALRQSQEAKPRREERPGRNEERHNRNERAARHSAPATSAGEEHAIGASLRRALDEEFSISFSAFSPKKKAVTDTTAVDSKEFEVDIATAAYLIEDIPCGFPIPDGKAVEVIGVRFRNAGKVYFFSPGGDSFRIGESVLVDTARGPELGEVVMLNRKIAEKNVVQPLRAVLRRATEKDLEHERENHCKEREALNVCAAKIAEHGLDMKLVDAQYTFDNSKLLFYFTSEGRVDFRDLVRDLAGIFRTRIELRQIGIRDESRLIGGLGMCGRPFCCTTFLSDFGQVSIKMAKEQGLSINASKISDCCGRLMCCLRYEHETYAAESRLTPKKDTAVQTPDGPGVVTEATPLAGTVKVRLDSAPEEAPHLYHRDLVSVIARERSAAKEKEPAPKKPEADEN